jgi:hypothetical protein
MNIKVCYGDINEKSDISPFSSEDILRELCTNLTPIHVRHVQENSTYITTTNNTYYINTRGPILAMELLQKCNKFTEIAMLGQNIHLII